MSKGCVMLDMDDVPHLSEEQKRSILASVPPWQRGTRKSGLPGLGAGVIYPVPEDVFLIDPIQIPAHWPRSYGMDPGWNCTAVIWFAWDVDSPGGGAIAYDEYYRGMADPAVHVAAINKRGSWIPGVIDPAAQGARGLQGEILLDVYRDLGLKVELADNTVVPGLVKVWDMLSTQQLRVFRTLKNFRSEMRLYRRDEKGNIVKKNDHLMDATRYNVMSGQQYALVQPEVSGQNAPWFTYTPPAVWSG